MNEFYDGTKLMSLSDLNGNKPEIYICTSNRSAGKTTFFGRYCMNRFLKYNEKFGVLYRFQYELDDCADKFFKDISALFFPGYTLKNKRRASGIFHELLLFEPGTEDDDDYEPLELGYAISLNSADQLKKYSHLFSDIQRILFDEFQSENNHYCSDEIRKFISVHTSIARGHGKQSRYLPVYMLSNPVSLLNPYYISLGITDRLQGDTKFLKGDGFVLEQGFNQAASDAQKESSFNRAFKNDSYMGYSQESIYLNDSQTFIENPSGKSNYICTLKYNGSLYGIREFQELGIVYADNTPDLSFRTKISVSTEDHDINYVMLKRNTVLLDVLRFYFEHGVFRFKNLRCKEAILKALSY